jgi:RsiW-degrading membrane proteinase PrsW (M82 family)
MSFDSVLHLLVGLLPVAAFLATLVYLDSYKLVKPMLVLGVVAAGGLMAGGGYFVNGWLLDQTQLEISVYSRFVAPIVEETLKGALIVVLLKSRRIGFLIDAAIFGFAVGTGFALVENIYYLSLLQEATIATWVVRGFGTAIMHGGTTAIFAVTTLALLERKGRTMPRAMWPGFCIAMILHSAYNHLTFSPRISTLTVAIAMPLLLYFVLIRSERAVGDWLGKGFDADAEMLELINSGKLSDSPVGVYLHSLKDKFHGPVVADILCYIRLYTELALRAKGILLMRENGFDVAPDEPTKAKFEEMRYLEGSIGKTGLLAIQPLLHMSHKDLWQLYMLGK